MREIRSGQPGTNVQATEQQAAKLPAAWVHKVAVTFEDASFDEAFAQNRVKDPKSLPAPVREAFDALKKEHPKANYGAYKVRVGNRDTYALRADAKGISNALIVTNSGQKVLSGVAPFIKGQMSGEYGWD